MAKEPNKKRPRLRTVNKVQAPYPLNQFPPGFGIALGKELIYLLGTKSSPSLAGKEWEEIFAICVGADWTPSNVGLDDVVLGSFAWGAKTIKASSPAKQKTVRLISGRNSITYSFGESPTIKDDPNHVGPMVLDIWNERVSSVREKHQELRTVVLIKSKDLKEVAVFEFETIRYDPELFYWEWNQRGNLEGFDKKFKNHQFTWQTHGSQFTIKEKVPENILIVKVQAPKKTDKEDYLKNLGFDESWIEVIRKK